MDLRQIEYFTQLYKDLNITKASRNLFISQQGLSKSLSKLEKEIGLPLFNRSVQGVFPTDTADRLYASFTKVTEAYHDLLDEVYHIQGRKILNIGAPVFFSTCCGRDEFGYFERTHPEIQVSYKEMADEDVKEGLLSGRLDVAYMNSPVPDDFAKHVQIHKDPVCIVVNSKHRLADRKQVSINDLNANEILFLDCLSFINHQVIHYMNQADIEYRSREPVSVNAFIMRIHGSLTVGIASRLFFRYFDFPEIRYIPFAMQGGISLYSEVFLVSAKGRSLSDEAEEYIEEVILRRKDNTE